MFIPRQAKQKYYSIDGKYLIYKCNFKLILIINFYIAIEWIGSDISQEIKTLLKCEMENPISYSDESGLIYVYCLREGKFEILIKLNYF